MWVEVVKSIALKPARSSSGATVRHFAVSIPRAAHRHWLPSRSEVSTSSMSAMVTRQQPRHVAGVDPTSLEFGVGEQRRMKRQVGGDAAYPGVCDRLPHAADRRGSVGRMDDDLGHQGIIVRRYAHSRSDVRIHAYAGTARPVDLAQLARAGTKVARRIFGVHAAF